MDELLRLINEESRKRGVTVELFLADLLAQRLDPRDRVDVYRISLKRVEGHAAHTFIKVFKPAA